MHEYQRGASFKIGIRDRYTFYVAVTSEYNPKTETED